MSRFEDARTTARLLILLSALTASLPRIASAAPRASREKQEARISRALHGVSDSDWTTIAGARVSEEYEVTRGETLWAISQKLFNDANYWPKVWALNNGRILNAHRIKPGMKLAFAPGSTTSPPALAVVPTDAGAPAPTEAALTSATAPVPAPPASRDTVTSSAAASGRSEEWKKLAHQPWETTEIQLPPGVDRFGFDASTKSLNLRQWPARGLESEGIPYSDKLESLGRIIGARQESSMLGFGDLVYIEPEAELQVGETYTVTSEPALLKSPSSDRSGWSYSVDGTVRILGVKDGIFLGRIESARNGIFRDSEITPLVKKVRLPAPIPGPGPIGAVLFLDPRDSSTSTGQFKQVYVDRGSEDGIQPGMVFRAYQYTDPGTGEQVFENETVIDGDILVLKTSARISLGIVLGNYSPILEDSPLRLLTDISDVMTKAGFRPRTQEEAAQDQQLDELEKVPPTDGLSPDEQKELDQLEQWKGNPPAVDKALEGKDLRELTPGVESPDAPPPAPTDEAMPPAEETMPPPTDGDATPPPETTEETPPPTADELPPPAEDSGTTDSAPPPEVPTDTETPPVEASPDSDLPPPPPGE